MDDNTDKNSDAQETSATPQRGKNKGVHVRAWIWWLCLSGLLFFLAQYLESYDRKYLVPSLVVVLLGCVASARAFWIQYVNNHGKHLDAHLRAAGIILIGVVFCGWLWWRGGSEKPTPTPNFLWSLQIGGSSSKELSLTNECLFFRYFDKTGDLPNGAEMLNVRVPAFILIPVQDGESNKVFNFTVENHSQLLIKDPEFIFGVPNQWKITVDSNKWVAGDSSMILYKQTEAVLKFMPSNMQFFAASKPTTLFPYDSINLPPITNVYPLQYLGNTLKGGLIEASIRCVDMNSEGYQMGLCANIFFAPASSNFFKPVVGCWKFTPDGTPVWPTEKELEASQK
jgi:hypothetical protein